MKMNKNQKIPNNDFINLHNYTDDEHNQKIKELYEEEQALKLQIEEKRKKM
jgi:hypothetical protein